MRGRGEDRRGRGEERERTEQNRSEEMRRDEGLTSYYL
jgi:hypothetical protein